MWAVVVKTVPHNDVLWLWVPAFAGTTSRLWYAT
jgi:hypothetical protein